jgi:hypothetical protein
MAGREARMVHAAGGRSCSKMQDARNAAMVEFVRAAV